MTVAEIKMPAYEARDAFREYRAALKSRYSKEDEALVRAYHWLGKNGRVIDIIGAMQQAGSDERFRPKLAITRADAEMVYCRVWRDGSTMFATVPWVTRHATRTYIQLPSGTVQAWSGGEGSFDCRAKVPLVPPRYRPTGSLNNYFLLWEAEWVNVPSDPILLRPLGKNLYAVMAQWDLTPVEQAVLRAR